MTRRRFGILNPRSSIVRVLCRPCSHPSASRRLCGSTFGARLATTTAGIVLALATTLLPEAGMAAVPPNDLFANRAELIGTNVTVTGDIIGATTEPGEDTTSLWVTRYYTVWYTWTAPALGVAHFTVATPEGGFRPYLAYYRGTALTNLVRVATTQSGGVAVSAGDRLAVQLGSSFGGYGPYELTLGMTFPKPTSPNDSFANRLTVSEPEYFMDGSLWNARSEPGELLPEPTANQTLWWRVAPGPRRLIYVRATAPEFEAKVQLFRGNQLIGLSRVDLLDYTYSGKTFLLEAGLEYAIQLAAGSVPPDGTFQITAWTDTWENDAFTNATRLEGTNIVARGNNFFATLEPGEPRSYSGSSNTLWYSWAAPYTGRAFITTGSGYLSVFTGAAVNSLTPVLAPGASLIGVWSRTFAVTEGEIYHVQLSDGPDAVTWNLWIEPYLRATNDFFDQAVTLRSGKSLRNSVIGATVEPGEPVHRPGIATKSVWWKWQAPVNGLATLSSYLGIITNVTWAVYQGDAITALNPVATGVDIVRFSVIGGDWFHIAAVVPATVEGEIDFSITANVATAGVPIPGNLLQAPSWEGDEMFALRYWKAYMGRVHLANGGIGNADGVSRITLREGNGIWQEIPTVPGTRYRIRYAYMIGGDSTSGSSNVTLQTLWDGREVGRTGVVYADRNYYHWAEHIAQASNTISRVDFVNISGQYNGVEVDAFSVVALDQPPRIVSPPASLSLLSGGLAVFSVGLEGASPMTFQWYLDGKPLAGETNRSLLLDPVSSWDAGVYHVHVSNEFGEAASPGATLVVLEASTPEIYHQPEGDTLLAGTYLNLNVVAIGTPPLAYKWHFNGMLLPAATNRNIVFTSVHATNAGTYTVIVSNLKGEALSLPATIEVQEPGDPNLNGRFEFSNKTTSIDAPMLDIDGSTRLNGPNYVAQPYVGRTTDSLGPIGLPSPLRSGFMAGYIMPQIVKVPGILEGEPALVEVRAWDRLRGESYEEARAVGGRFGRSAPINIIMGGGVVIPPKLVSLASFSLRTGLPFFSTGRIERLQQHADGTILWALHGSPGFRYLIEKSEARGHPEWKPFLILTNETGTVAFSDTANGSRAAIYRARILD